MSYLKNVNRKLKIGPNCFYMNISAVFEVNDVLYHSLAYTNFDFLFNKEYFTKFIEPKPPMEYISKDNELIIAEDISSLYISDLGYYATEISKNFSNYELKVISSGDKVDLQDIKKNYLEENIPVIFTLDHYYLYEDYRKITQDILHFHTPNHMAVLCNIDFDKREAYIIDKFYSFVGVVALDNLIKAIQSSYIEERTFLCLYLNEFKEISQEEAFVESLIKNIDKMQEENFDIDGRVYQKNIGALKSFVDSFQGVIEELYRQKEKYAPQFFSKLLTPIILQRISFNNLMQYLNENFDNEYYKRLAPLAEKSSKLWAKIDIYNDKSYLSGTTILQAIDKYKKLLEEIIVVDGEVYDILGEFAKVKKKK